MEAYLHPCMQWTLYSVALNRNGMEIQSKGRVNAQDEPRPTSSECDKFISSTLGRDLMRSKCPIICVFTLIELIPSGIHMNLLMYSKAFAQINGTLSGESMRHAEQMSQTDSPISHGSGPTSALIHHLLPNNFE